MNDDANIVKTQYIMSNNHTDYQSKITTEHTRTQNRQQHTREGTRRNKRTNIHTINITVFNHCLYV